MLKVHRGICTATSRIAGNVSESSNCWPLRRSALEDRERYTERTLDGHSDCTCYASNDLRNQAVTVRVEFRFRRSGSRYC